MKVKYWLDKQNKKINKTKSLVSEWKNKILKSIVKWSKSRENQKEKLYMKEET